MNHRRGPRRHAPEFSPGELEGGTDASRLFVTVVCARWNPTITDPMLGSALEALAACGAKSENVRIVRVPGAFELPAAVRMALKDDECDAVIALGAIVRGETTHHEVLGHAVGSALAAISAESGRPVGFGLLTCDTMDQARARTDKGAEAAQAAVEMANLRRRMETG